jgi:hypothetical protein
MSAYKFFTNILQKVAKIKFILILSKKILKSLKQNHVPSN